MFVPKIETVVTKHDKGVGAAEHRPTEEVIADIEAGATRAIER